MVKPERVLVATLAEDREPYAQEAEYVFRTLERFGGRLSAAKRIAYFVGSADSEAARQLTDLGVPIKIVEPLDDRCPHANKIHMLDDGQDFDYLVALDTDVVIVRDFSAYVQGSSVSAKPAGKPRLSLDEWRQVFGQFGLALPACRYLTTASMEETIPYFNTGVMIVPREHVAALRRSWHAFVEKILDDLPRIAERRVFIDQFALALAIASTQMPYRALPLELNFPTDRPLNRGLEADRLKPYILHHHHRLSPTGELLTCPYENVNATIEQVNSFLSLADVRTPVQA